MQPLVHEKSPDWLNIVLLIMLKAKKVYWFAQIGGWLMLSLLLLFSSLAYGEKQISENINLTGQIIWATVVFFLLGITLTHLMRATFLSFGWLNMKLGPLVPRALIATVVFAAFMTLGTNLFGYIQDPDRNPISLLNFALDVFATSLFFLLWNSVYFTFHFFQRSKEQEVNNIQLTASHNEIELKNLRSQLNPHFLFNSLNSIRALIDLDPDQAKINVTKLSGLLRKSLILGKEQLVTLEEELAIVNDYLDLEKVRFEERVTIFQEHDPNLLNRQIPPFILQTLVENAIKHGVSKRIEGSTIWIRSYMDNDAAKLEVSNEGNLEHNEDAGIGIANTMRRLELQYRGKAHFELFEKEGIVHAVITIKEI